MTISSRKSPENDTPRGETPRQVSPSGVRDVRDESLLARLNLPIQTADALYAAAFTNLSAGRLERAERLFGALCLLDDNRPESCLGYGICLARRGDRANAETVFQLAASMNSHWAVPHFHLASIYIADCRWQAADAALMAFFRHATTDIATELLADAKRMRAFVCSVLDPGKTHAPAGGRAQ